MSLITSFPDDNTETVSKTMDFYSVLMQLIDHPRRVHKKKNHPNPIWRVLHNILLAIMWNPCNEEANNINKTLYPCVMTNEILEIFIFP